jgi:hypothetical protein
MAQILDAGAANFAQPCERCGVRAGLEQKIRAGACAFRSSTEMRCPQEHKIIDAIRPGVASPRGVVDCRAGDQAAHAVRDDHQSLERMRPFAHQYVQQRREFGRLRELASDMTDLKALSEEQALTQ